MIELQDFRSLFWPELHPIQKIALKPDFTLDNPPEIGYIQVVEPPENKAAMFLLPFTLVIAHEDLPPKERATPAQVRELKELYRSDLNHKRIYRSDATAAIKARKSWRPIRLKKETAMEHFLRKSEQTQTR